MCIVAGNEQLQRLHNVQICMQCSSSNLLRVKRTNDSLLLILQATLFLSNQRLKPHQQHMPQLFMPIFSNPCSNLIQPFQIAPHPLLISRSIQHNHILQPKNQAVQSHRPIDSDFYGELPDRLRG